VILIKQKSAKLNRFTLSVVLLYCYVMMYKNWLIKFVKNYNKIDTSRKKL